MAISAKRQIFGEHCKQELFSLAGFHKPRVKQRFPKQVTLFVKMEQIGSKKILVRGAIRVQHGGAGIYKVYVF